MSDLIDRQTVIEIIQSMYPQIPRIPWMRKDWQERYEPYIRTENAIRELPSAQPERTCVNCGRTVNNGGWYADGGTRCPIEEHYALPKDGYCHLWEKRNVTDDDYPERRTDET